MSRLIRRADRGFALAYLALALFILATLGVVALASYTRTSAPRKSAAGIGVDAVYHAITGYPNSENFGYLGDVGDYPAKLSDLVQAPPSTPGWNGPYLLNVPVNNTMLIDAYGSPLEYFLSIGSTDKIGIVSRGPDLTSSNMVSNPNIASAPAPFPGTAAYPIAAYNPDNVGYPDFNSDANAIYYENAGTLTYFIWNYDITSQYPTLAKLRPGCPGLYTINVTSATRGTSDTIALQYPESPTPSSGTPTEPVARGAMIVLGQGVYDVSVSSAISGPVFAERVNIQAGSRVIRNVTAPMIDSSTTPLVTFTIYNNHNITPPPTLLTLRDVNGNSIDTITAAQSPKTLTLLPALQMHACMPLTVTQNTVGNEWDAFLLPYLASYTRYVGERLVPIPDPTPPRDMQPRYTLTVTNGGTESDELKVVQATGTLLGTVYKRKTATIQVSANTAANGGTAGVVVNIVKKDGTPLLPAVSINVTGNTTTTVP